MICTTIGGTIKPMLIEKLCNKCKKVKLAVEFSGRPERPNGLYSCCKECKREYRMARYQQRRKEDPIELWLFNAFHWAKDRARKKGIPFDLSKEDVIEALRESSNKCTYCSIELNFRRTISTRSDSPTVDRLICSQGYSRENIVVCCYRCNALKGDATPSEMITIATIAARIIGKRKLICSGQGSIPAWGSCHGIFQP